MDIVAPNSITFLIMLGVIGICIGSFLNVVILRLPTRLQYEWDCQCKELLNIKSDPDETLPAPSLISPRSACTACNTPLKPWHNIPLLSYLFLMGKCAFCKQSISLRYPIIELVCCFATYHAGITLGPTPELFAALLLIWSLIALTMIDYDHQLLPDNITLPLLWIGLIANSFEIFTSLQEAVFGAIAGYLVLWTIYQIHHFITKKQGMGYGDFKLLAVLGAWFGWKLLPLIIILSAGAGTVIACLLIVFRNHAHNKPIPFGPYLAIAGWLTLFWGDELLSHYLQFLGI